MAEDDLPFLILLPPHGELSTPLFYLLLRLKPKASDMLSKSSTSCTLMVAFKESFLAASVGGPGGEAWAQKIQNDSQCLQEQARETLM